MTKFLIALASAGLLTLGGCAGTTNGTGSTQASAQSATSGISAAAQAALKQAENDVAASKKDKNEWTTAAAALKNAHEAAKKGDSDAVLKSAKFASELAKLSIGQLKYPTTDVLN
ncbi:hypothetical protein TPL01_16950 [Sulfuriferula plumbiphila]|uniref:SoxXA-binding protein n=1 Tax=Sulfuriferula plumbiphila TaxID=171865 RepID=A0A512L7W2_9PROT|nr:hypothetical protein [Sulfuriferula plumbiphila]BBP04531.1 hypothetical protein SFPGR_19530 [Sulfuriferula plumbiphila]GEP30557.1 hypothetical protein TPL01_16950 [Sulfuriferula plumbiphila]